MSKVIVICGATATGKSDIALDIAERIGAEIINADSMQLYRGMDIGTAKLKVAERREIAHHLLDVLDVTEDSTVAWYQEHARSAIAEIHSRGLHAIIVGGTGLYIKAILDDLNFPETDPQVRANLEKLGEEFGATTGRKRQVRWLDLDGVIQAMHINNITHLIINKVDILDAVGYYGVYAEGRFHEFHDPALFRVFVEAHIRKHYQAELTDIMWSSSPEKI